MKSKKKTDLLAASRQKNRKTKLVSAAATAAAAAAAATVPELVEGTQERPVPETDPVLVVAYDTESVLKLQSYGRMLMSIRQLKGRKLGWMDVQSRFVII